MARTQYLLCLDAACRVFPVRQIATADEDATPDAHAWDPAGLWDIGPERCLAGLIAAGCLSRDAQLGPWQRARQGEVIGYWTVEVPAYAASRDDAS